MEYIIFGNEQTKVYFGEEKGYLEKIEYKGRTIDLHSKLWSVQTKEGELGIADMTEFRHECYDGVIKLFWANDIAKVGITVKNGEDGKLRWRINADVFGGEVVRRVKFPILEGLNFDTENYLLITWQNGHLVKNPVDTFLCKGLEVPFWVGYGTGAYKNEYPAALSFQYGAFYGQDYGYYFVTEDPDAYIKTFEYEYNKEKHAMDLTIVNYPENMGKTTSYCMAYDFVLKLFEGDWQTATNYYRDWAIRQKWCKKKLSEKKLPEKLVKTDLWRINHHDYEMGTRTQEYFDTALKIRDAVDCNLALHWYGWNMSAHDKDYPEYISDEMKAKGWMEELTNWNKKFDDEGIVKIPYHNARLWEIKTKTWDGMNVAASAIKDETGNFPDEPWMPEMGYELKAVCPATALWQNRVADLCREYGTEVGFDGVYLDQLSCRPYFCFNPDHHHVFDDWSEHYNTILLRIADRYWQTHGEPLYISGEWLTDTHGSLVDLGLFQTFFKYHTGAFPEMYRYTFPEHGIADMLYPSRNLAMRPTHISQVSEQLMARLFCNGSYFWVYDLEEDNTFRRDPVGYARLQTLCALSTMRRTLLPNAVYRERDGIACTDGAVCLSRFADTEADLLCLYTYSSGDDVSIRLSNTYRKAVKYTADGGETVCSLSNGMLTIPRTTSLILLKK